MTDDIAPICTLYVNHNNNRRLLYVVEAADFPVRMFNQDEWRMIASGVVPPPSGAMSLNRRAYYPSWLPKEAKAPRRRA